MVELLKLWKMSSQGMKPGSNSTIQKTKASNGLLNMKKFQRSSAVNETLAKSRSLFSTAAVASYLLCFLEKVPQ